MSVSNVDAAQFDIGRVISRTVGLISRNAVPFGILSLLFAGAPYFIIQMMMPSLIQGDPSMLGTVMILGALVSLVAGMVLQGALTRASIDDLSGAGANVSAALSAAVAVLLPMVGLGILMGLGIGVGMMLLLVPGIYLALCWAVSAPVLVVERLGIVGSMKRSTALTQNHRWAILGLVVLFVVIVILINLIVGFLIPGGAMALMGLPGEGTPYLAFIVLTGVQVFTSMIATAGVASIYFELRQVKDGLGVTDLAKVFA